MKNQPSSRLADSKVLSGQATMNKYSNTTQRPSQPTSKQIQLLTKKAAYWQPRAQTTHIDSQMMIPCINCEVLIALNQIDRHSFKCTTVSKNVMAIGKSPQIFEEIDYKIQRLKESIRQIIDQVKRKEIPKTGASEQTAQKLKYLCRAFEIADALIMVQSLQSIEERKLKDVEEELKILSSEYEGSLGVALYMERLHSLILQKLSVFKKQKQRQQGQDNTSKTLKQNKCQENFFNSYQSTLTLQINSPSKFSVEHSQTTTKDQLKNLIQEKKQDINQMKNITQMYQQRTQTSQQQMNNVMNIKYSQLISPGQQQFQFQSPLNKDLGSNNSRYWSPDLIGRPTLITKFSGSYDRTQQDGNGQKSEILTQISSSQWQSEAGHFEDHQGTAQFQSTGDQLQRVFYSQCLNLKTKLPANHPAQKIPVIIQSINIINFYQNYIYVQFFPVLLKPVQDQQFKNKLHLL